MNAIKNMATGSKLLKAIRFFSGLSPDAKKLLAELRKVKNTFDPEKLISVRTDRTILNSDTFKIH